MRKVEFRFWNTDYKNPIIEYFDLSDTEINILALQRAQGKIIMQYTGLTDKNGKKIFEGDIIKFYSHYGWDKRIVEYDNDYACFKIGNKHIKGLGEKGTPRLLNKKCEIIGNKFENPELIKE